MSEKITEQPEWHVPTPDKTREEEEQHCSYCNDHGCRNCSCPYCGWGPYFGWGSSGSCPSCGGA